MTLSQPDKSQLAAIKLAVFFLALVPLAQLAWGGYADSLGPNPIETITSKTGTWTFNFLLITLTVTPLRKLSEWHWLLRLRRMLGLFCFFYACLHFTTFVWFDHFFDWRAIAKDVVKRPFVTAGFAAFVLLIPLAATSNSWAIRRLGGKRWQALHRTVYAVGIVACVHYFWLVKPIALLYPLSYALILAVLLGYRVRLRKAAYGPFLAPNADPAHAAIRGSAAAKPVTFYPTRPR